jgi:hypothetical protein
MTGTPSELKLLSELKAVIEIGIADSHAGSFTEFNSKETLSAHLSALRATEGPEHFPGLTTGPERTPLKPWTREQADAYKKQRLEEVNDANSDK